jgi:hypothetical protein
MRAGQHVLHAAALGCLGGMRAGQGKVHQRSRVRACRQPLISPWESCTRVCGGALQGAARRSGRRQSGGAGHVRGVRADVLCMLWASA